MKQQAKSTFVLTKPSEILEALVGLKDVRGLHYRRQEREVELMIEQIVEVVRCPTCSGRAQVKELPVVSDLPVHGTPMRLSWKKHRMRCPSQTCAKRTWVLSDHRIAAKSCLPTTRAAKWATAQVGTGRTVQEVAGELDCDWHTVNDAVTTYGSALLKADRKRLNKTTAIGLDETSFIKLGSRGYRDYATTVADVENHQIIDILPSRKFTDVAGWIPASWDSLKRPSELSAQWLRKGDKNRETRNERFSLVRPAVLPAPRLPSAVEILERLRRGCSSTAVSIEFR